MDLVFVHKSTRCSTRRYEPYSQQKQRGRFGHWRKWGRTCLRVRHSYKRAGGIRQTCIIRKHLAESGTTWVCRVALTVFGIETSVNRRAQGKQGHRCYIILQAVKVGRKTRVGAWSAIGLSGKCSRTGKGRSAAQQIATRERGGNLEQKVTHVSR